MLTSANRFGGVEKSAPDALQSAQRAGVRQRVAPDPENSEYARPTAQIDNGR